MRKNKIKQTILLITFGVFALVQVFPLYWLLTYSLKTNAEILGDNILGLPFVPQVSNYVRVVTESSIPRYFINSVIYAIIVVAAVALLSSMAGYALSKMKWKHNGFGLMYIAIGIMIPASAKLLPIFQVLDKIGIKGSPAGLVLVYIAAQLPVATMIVYGFGRGIPDEIQESAFLDGCNLYKMFFRVVLPLLKTPIVTAAVFTFLHVWNEFMFAITLLDDNANYTLPVGIMSFSGENQQNLGLIGAGLVIATIPSLLFYFIFSRQIQSGITDGAVKG